MTEQTGDTTGESMRHFHKYERVGPAADFNGQACVLWRCGCGKELELFEDIDPPENSWAKATDD